jgi:uncharacterized RDD family membrane protein YckC
MKNATPINFTPLITAESLFHKRISAFTIDMIAIVISTKLLVLSYRWFLMKYAYPLVHSIRYEMPRVEVYLETLTLLSVYGCYFFFTLYLSQGKTLGKSLLGLRVVSKEQPGIIEWWQALSRTVGYYACYFSGLILFLLPLTNKSQAGLSDWISSTQVISDKQWEEVTSLRAGLELEKNNKHHGLELLIHGYDELESPSKKAA